MDKQTINTQIEKARKQLRKWEDTLKEFEAQEEAKQNIKRWLDIGNGLEISELIHKGKTYKECLNLLNKGETIADYPLLQKLRNENKDKRFIDFWAFVPNPDAISKDNKYVARFGANSGGAFLVCSRVPTLTGGSLGVFLVRKRLRGKNDN